MAGAPAGEMPRPTHDVDVVVVGGGPVGLTAANLLAAAGHTVTLFERNATTSDEAKAISIDDDSLRVLQRCGLAGKALDIVVPGVGTRYYDRRGRPLLLAGTATPLRSGYPFKNPFSQPELERVLLAGLARRTRVAAVFSTAVVGLHDHTDAVVVETAPAAGDGPGSTLRTRFVLGCDGGRSTVRELLGIGMTGRSFEDVWLVVDTVGDPHDEQYGMHVGRPERPHVIIPGRDGRCRYEFRLRRGEGVPGEPPPFALVRRLVAPYRALRPEHVERAVCYRFNAVVADAWQAGRCFLLGDAAHMMPPFAGQGLNSGLRDASNLAWKVSGVLDGRLDASTLTSYQAERRPHADATVRLSALLGSVVMTDRPGIAVARDAAVRILLTLPWGRHYLQQTRYRPSSRVRRGLVAARSRGRARSLVGHALPQPVVFDTAGGRSILLDEVLGAGWAVIGVDVGTGRWGGIAADPAVLALEAHLVEVSTERRLPRGAPGRSGVGDVDGRLVAALRAASTQVVLVRPDRVVAGVGPADDLTWLDELVSPWLHPSRRVPSPASPTRRPTVRT